MSQLPRGIRNHNPGNIEKGDPWQGLAADQSADKRFAVFEGPEWGIRALARVLITYQDRHGLRTPWEIASRWAPPVENDTRAYAAHLAKRLGVTPHDGIDVHDYAVMRPLVEAIIQHENGLQPYDALTINEGLRLAGVRPPAEAQRDALEEARPLGKTRTSRAGRAAEAAGGVAIISGAIAAFGEALPVLKDAAELMRENAPGLLMFVGLVVVLAGGWVLYARWSDRERGLR
ncbi:MAG TPA: structural protein [Kiloniellales bacterium]|nr:structural protein [Kiloniellales bacterium]